MSTILIDRRTAVLLGELAAEAPAAPRTEPAAVVDGVALGLVARPRALPSRAATAKTAVVRAELATRRSLPPRIERSRRLPGVTVRGSSAGDVRLQERLRCDAARVQRPARVGTVLDARRTPPRAVEKAGLHLTRRGRLVALLLLFVVLTVAFSVGRVTSTALGNPNAPSAEVVVQRGDTLWAIAERIAPNADPRATAQEIMAVNGLGSPSLEAGQHLRLP